MATKVKLNSTGIKLLLHSPEIVAELQTRAARVLSAAQADPHDDTGAYEAALHIETTTGGTRARVKVVAGDWKGHILEARYGILSRALDQAGGA